MLLLVRGFSFIYTHYMTKIIDKLAWLHIKDRKVLFARSTREPQMFYTVGGKREEGESDVAALVREVAEEANVSLILDTITHLHSFEGPAHGHGTDTVLKMTCYTADYEGELMPSSEIAELMWLSSADTVHTTEMGNSILTWLREQDLID